MKLYDLFGVLNDNITVEVTTGENISVYDGKNSILESLNFSTVDAITLGDKCDLTVCITLEE